jgi:hypothetical protein
METDKSPGGRLGLFVALSEKLFQTLLFDRYSCAGGLCHLLRHFRQVHSHSSEYFKNPSSRLADRFSLFDESL